MFLFFDTETTGLPTKGQYKNPRHPLTPKLIELGAVLCDENGNVADEFVHIIKPYGFVIPTVASLVHGITTARAEAEGIELKIAFEKFLDFVERSHTLVAHNAAYDQLILDRVMLDLSYEGSFTIGRPILCTKELTTPICKLPSPWGSGFKWPNLQEAHRFFFNEDFTGAHGALADVKACARVFFDGRARNLWV